jgi:hypothetical protein
MMTTAQQSLGAQPARITIPSEADRKRIIARCSAYGALGWVITELAYELMLGPHIRLLRSVAVGSVVGALVGLLVASLQWSVLRHYVRGASLWVAATTAGYTLGGFLGGFLIYLAVAQTDIFRSTLALQGILSSGITGLVVGAIQWPMLKEWVGPALRWQSWIVPVTVGSALAAPVAGLAGGAVLALLAVTIGEGPWPLIVVGSYLTAAIAGSIVYRRFLASGFRRVLPAPEPPPSTAPAQVAPIAPEGNVDHAIPDNPTGSI